MKTELAVAITKLIEQKGWTQAETALHLNIDQSKFSALMRGHLARLSVSRLFVIINQLGHDIEVRISAKETAAAKTQTRVIIV